MAIYRSIFHMPKMDCPSEERMVRLALGDAKVAQLDFDLPERNVTIWHEESVTAIQSRLVPLNYGASLRESSQVNEPLSSAEAGNDTAERRLLVWALGLNALMFVVEIVAGLWAESMGLIADSLDMFADSAVYGVSLYAVGRAASVKLKAAHVTGWLQLALASVVVIETARRFFFGSEPESTVMIIVSLAALAVNVAVLVMLSRNKGGGVHIRASQICTSNDVLANLGVIVAGVLVAWTGSQVPDLVFGALIGAVVGRGAIQILRLR